MRLPLLVMAVTSSLFSVHQPVLNSVSGIISNEAVKKDRKRWNSQRQSDGCHSV